MLFLLETETCRNRECIPPSFIDACNTWLMSAPTSTPSFSFNSQHNNSPILLPRFFQSLGFQSLWLVQNVLLKIKVIVFAFLMQMLYHMAPPNAYEGQRWACEVVSATQYSDTHHDRIVMRPVLLQPPCPAVYLSHCQSHRCSRDQCKIS